MRVDLGIMPNDDGPYEILEKDFAVLRELANKLDKKVTAQHSQLRILAEAVLNCHVSEIYTENEDAHNNTARLQFKDCQCPACQLAREIMGG